MKHAILTKRQTYKRITKIGGIDYRISSILLRINICLEYRFRCSIGLPCKAKRETSMDAELVPSVPKTMVLGPTEVEFRKLSSCGLKMTGALN
jgi:hypothetical protein